jgi:hypothetical protein
MRYRTAALVLSGLLAVYTVGALAQAQDEPTPKPEVKTEAELQQQREQQVTPPSGTVEEAVTKVQASGLMGGYPDGKFHAEQPLTRAELASILAKTFKLNERKLTQPAPTTPLKDVPPGYWAANDINTVVAHHVMEGYRDGYFYPDQKITRAEALAIFAQAYGVHQYDDSTVQAVLSQYPDAGQIPDWARKAMVTSLKNGFVDTPPAQQIRPMQSMTRGDMAFALSQYLDRLHETEQPTTPH